MKSRIFKIVDIDAEQIVECVKTRKEIFVCLDDFIDYLNWSDDVDCSDMFSILYDDGTKDVIDMSYDGHKIRKQHIVSMVYDNDASVMVYGSFSMNEYGVVTTSFEEEISDYNIVEVK